MKTKKISFLFFFYEINVGFWLLKTNVGDTKMGDGQTMAVKRLQKNVRIYTASVHF